MEQRADEEIIVIVGALERQSLLDVLGLTELLVKGLLLVLAVTSTAGRVHEFGTPECSHNFAIPDVPQDINTVTAAQVQTHGE
ncbi:hypothetical protein WG66_008001 [Moniliophthora roreri]|nr:hypothetical protein WG66_008001 [Moniliophthora roreri]